MLRFLEESPDLREDLVQVIKNMYIIINNNSQNVKKKLEHRNMNWNDEKNTFNDHENTVYSLVDENYRQLTSGFEQFELFKVLDT